MIGTILEALAAFIIALISFGGYWGILLAMAIESACIPLPSEVIMPFSGYLVSTGQFTLWGAALAGAFGCVVGSLVAYIVGRYGGRELVWRYGRYIFLSHHDVELADRLFARYGQWVVFASRLLPVIRTFISLPAGIARMPVIPFLFYTFIGSLPWCYALAYVGFRLGANWDTLGAYFHRFDAAIGVALLAGIIWWIRRHLKHAKCATAS